MFSPPLLGDMVGFGGGVLVGWGCVWLVRGVVRDFYVI